MATVRRTMIAKVVQLSKGPSSTIRIMVHARTADGPEGIIVPWLDANQVPKINSTVKIFADFEVE